MSREALSGSSSWEVSLSSERSQVQFLSPPPPPNQASIHHYVQKKKGPWVDDNDFRKRIITTKINISTSFMLQIPTQLGCISFPGVVLCGWVGFLFFLCVSCCVGGWEGGRLICILYTGSKPNDAKYGSPMPCLFFFIRYGSPMLSG